MQKEIRNTRLMGLGMIIVLLVMIAFIATSGILSP
jgi:hypothetical protein